MDKKILKKIKELMKIKSIIGPKEIDEILDYNIYKQPYETAVFPLGSDNDIFIAHYNTKEDALKGHGVVTRLILEDGIEKLKELNMADERPWWENKKEKVS